MASIFHYTDTAGAVGILTSQSLFASDTRYLNDSSEGSLIDSLLAPMFLNEVAMVSRELIDAELLSRKYYEELGSNADKLQVDALFRSIRTTINSVSPSFVVSFCRHNEGSEHFNHGLLSQWRGYADRGGFAFEFDEDGLDTLLKEEVKRFFFGPIATREVVYRNFEDLFNKDDYEGLARAMVGQIFLDPKATPIQDFKKRAKVKTIVGDKDIDLAISKYLSTAPFLKDYGFHEECEYRIAVACVRSDKIPSDSKKLAKPIEFRTRGNLILPYISLFNEPGMKLPIKAIIVGPHPHQELQRDAIKRLLETKRCRATVRLSSIPFRGY
jgi:Protein of unknown function (DUF2971)